MTITPRIELFADVYRECNAGNSKQKLVNLPRFSKLYDV